MMTLEGERSRLRRQRKVENRESEGGKAFELNNSIKGKSVSYNIEFMRELMHTGKHYMDSHKKKVSM